MDGFRFSAFWRAAVLAVVSAYLILVTAFFPRLPMALPVQYMFVILVGLLLCCPFAGRSRVTIVRAIGHASRLLVARGGGMVLVLGVMGYTTMESPAVAAVEPPPVVESASLSRLDNPLRAAALKLMAEDAAKGWAAYNDIVEAGRAVYDQNCFFCHGDLLAGKGPDARSFRPQLGNFQAAGSAAQLQAAYLFWELSSAGLGLGKEEAGWNPVMPVWHEMLDETQVWQAVTFLFDEAGQVPQIAGAGVSNAVGGKQDRLGAGLRGKALYAHRCQVCHGGQGAGDGVAADRLYPRPRDFTLALFKYKTSPGTELPTDENLFNTIKRGLTGSGMPAWGGLLSDEQIRSLIPVIKGFDVTAAWAPEDADDTDFDDDGRYLKTDFRSITRTEPLPSPVPFSGESVAKGKRVFEKICAKCHGLEGRGNITSGKKLEDDWSHRLWPRDLTKPWTWRVTNVAGEAENVRDETIRNIYTRLSIGLPGTPMPAHRATEAGNKDPISQRDRWHVANYVYSLRHQSVAPSDAPVLVATWINDDLPNSLTAEAWDAAPAVTLPLLPNIIKNARLFTPLNDSITVRVLYNRDEIAFLLELNDRTDSRPGEKVSTQIQDRQLALHSDAMAIQFPKQGVLGNQPMNLKQLFRHAGESYPSTMWYWNAGSVIPAVASQAVLLDIDQQIVPRPADARFTVQGAWLDGQWRVLMKRPRQGGDGGDISFNEGDFVPVSFVDWDGSNGELGSRHTRTTWYWLVLPESADASHSLGLFVVIGAGILLLGFFALRRMRKV